MKIFSPVSCLAGLVFALGLALPGRADDGFRPVSFPSLSLAPPGAFAADFYVDDRDRDPQGIDVFDVGLRFRYQAGERTELFSDFIIDRVVSLPEAPAIPSAPRDLIWVGPSRSIPDAFVGEHPYVDKRGDARFDAFILGTATVGVARTFPTDFFDLGLSASLAIPMARGLHALRSGSGSGSVDATLAGLVAGDFLGGKSHTRVAFTLAGPGTLKNRAYVVSGGAVQVVQTPVGIGNRGEIGFAWVRALTESLAATIEARARKEFVGDDRIDAVSPVDVMIGVQRRWGRFTLSASLLNHFRALPSGERRANPLAGGIDLSNVSPAERTLFLVRNGLGSLAGDMRDGVHTVVMGLPAAALPEGAFRIDPTYNIRSEHNLGYIFTLTFRP